MNNEDNFWDLIAGDESVSVVKRSAFRAYVKGTGEMMILMSSLEISKENVKRRMVNLLRKNWEEKKNAAAGEKERCRRHMMKERMRREKQKQSYFALHSLLPVATKNDKNSIVQKAMDEIKKLQRLKMELERRIKVMEAKLDDDEMSETVVRFNLKEALMSGLDSMVEVLQCLKSMKIQIKSVCTNFSPHESSATMNIKTSQIRGEEVEKIVKRRLHETGWNLLFTPEASFHKDLFR